MPYSRLEISKYAETIGKSPRTLRRWVALGCRLKDAQSVKAFQVEMERKKTNVAKARERRGNAGKAKCARGVHAPAAFKPAGNGEVLPPAGKRGAAAALQRLEEQEERAHARLQLALESGDQLAVEGAQMFWVRCVESLRKLDLSIEFARRDAEQQVPLALAREVALYISDWLRIAFVQFLSAEARPLMGIRDVGEWKYYAMQRFKGILDLTVQSSLKTRSPIPEWAAEKVRESWNVQ